MQGVQEWQNPNVEDSIPRPAPLMIQSRENPVRIRLERLAAPSQAARRVAQALRKFAGSPPPGPGDAAPPGGGKAGA